MYKIGSIVRMKTFEDLVRGGVYVRNGSLFTPSKITLMDGREHYIMDLKKLAGNRFKLHRFTKDKRWYVAVNLSTKGTFFITDFMVDSCELSIIKCDVDEGEAKRSRDKRERAERKKHNNKIINWLKSRRK